MKRDWADKRYLRPRHRKSMSDRIAEWIFAGGVILALSILSGFLDR